MKNNKTADDEFLKKMSAYNGYKETTVDDDDIIFLDTQTITGDAACELIDALMFTDDLLFDHARNAYVPSQFADQSFLLRRPRVSQYSVDALKTRVFEMEPGSDIYYLSIYQEDKSKIKNERYAWCVRITPRFKYYRGGM